MSITSRAGRDSVAGANARDVDTLVSACCVSAASFADAPALGARNFRTSALKVTASSPVNLTHFREKRLC